LLAAFVDTASGAVLAAVADARTLALEPAAPFAQRREPAFAARSRHRG
jgi:hypothetical protein